MTPLRSRRGGAVQLKVTCRGLALLTNKEYGAAEGTRNSEFRESEIGRDGIASNKLNINLMYVQWSLSIVATMGE